MDLDQENAGVSSNAERVANDTIEKLKAQNRAKWIRRRIFYICIAVLTCVIFMIACVALFFNMKTLTVTGSTIYDEAAIKATSGIEDSQNLYAIDKAEIENAIVMNFPYIKAVRVRRHLPTAIELEVVEDEPLYYFELCEEFFVLSDTLRVLERSENEQTLLERHPALVKLAPGGVSSAIVGQTLAFQDETMYTYTLDILHIFGTSSLRDGITQIHFSNKFNMWFMYENRFKVELGSSESLSRKMEVAAVIVYEKFQPEDSGIINVENEDAFVILNNSLMEQLA